MEIKIGDYRGWKSRIMLSLEVSFKQPYCGGWCVDAWISLVVMAPLLLSPLSPPPVLSEMISHQQAKPGGQQDQADMEETEDFSPLWFAGIYSNSSQDVRVIIFLY